MQCSTSNTSWPHRCRKGTQREGPRTQHKPGTLAHPLRRKRTSRKRCQPEGREDTPGPQQPARCMEKRKEGKEKEPESQLGKNWQDLSRSTHEEESPYLNIANNMVPPQHSIPPPTEMPRIANRATHSKPSGHHGHHVSSWRSGLPVEPLHGPGIALCSQYRHWPSQIQTSKKQKRWERNKYRGPAPVKPLLFGD